MSLTPEQREAAIEAMVAGFEGRVPFLTRDLPRATIAAAALDALLVDRVLLHRDDARAVQTFLDAYDAYMVGSVSRRTFGPMVEARRALAALGLDEPPTENRTPDVPQHYRDAIAAEVASEFEDAGFVADCIRSGPPPKIANGESCLECGRPFTRTHPSCGTHRMAGMDASPPEPPKACPTCGSGWTYHHACPDRGSGIDGGTH